MFTEIKENEQNTRTDKDIHLPYLLGTGIWFTQKNGLYLPKQESYLDDIFELPCTVIFCISYVFNKTYDLFTPTKYFQKNPPTPAPLPLVLPAAEHHQLKGERRRVQKWIRREGQVRGIEDGTLCFWPYNKTDFF